MTAEVIAMLPKGRRPRPPANARAPLKLFPRGGDRARLWLYAIGFVGGVVKFGRTTKPRSRLSQHWSKSNGAVEWAHLFGSGTRHWSYIAESQACDRAESAGTRVLKSEWFRGGISRAEAIEMGRAASQYATKTILEYDRRSKAAERQRVILARVGRMPIAELETLLSVKAA